MIRAQLAIDDAVGETRRCLIDATGKPFRLDIERWSERSARAKLDEVWWGRAHARLPGDRGWFIHLGQQPDGLIDGLLPGKINEGALIAVRVKSEARAGKSPALSLVDLPRSIPRPDRPQLHAAPDTDPFLAGVEIVSTVGNPGARATIDAAIEEALEPISPISGGGDLSIEPTRALTAIDIDSGARVLKPADIAAFNQTAAREAARQIALRNIGGLVAIDFLSMRDRSEREATVDSVRAALRDALGRASEVEPLSRTGVCLAAIAHRSRPIADALGPLEDEREALDALRLVESAGLSDPGRRIHAKISAIAAGWLSANVIDWEKALADRIGPRWTFEVVTRQPGVRPEVWAER